MQETRRAGALAPYARLLPIAGVVAAVDQITKTIAENQLADGPIDILGGLVTLHLTYNPGGAFGVLQGIPGFFLVATIVVIAFIILWARHLESPSLVVPLGLVLGGGIGNLLDRLFRDTGGRVVDFIDVHFWPVFNVADACISIGVVMILLASFRSERDKKASSQPT